MSARRAPTYACDKDMFTNVVIGLDGRQGGRDAIALARDLAAPQAIFTLVHVDAPFPGRGAVDAFPLERAESRGLLERERELAGVEARLVLCGPAAVGRGLHEVAEQQRADLLVVGSTRHALLGRVLLGDDCRAALNGTPCALGVAPLGYALAPHALLRLGVGYDGSPESEAAVRVARELSAAHAGVIKTLAQFQGVSGVAVHGGPRETLVQAGKELDLLIVGSRGYGPLGRLFHGGVSRYLVGHATCPLLVLPLPTPTTKDEQPEGERDARALSAVGG